MFIIFCLWKFKVLNKKNSISVRSFQSFCYGKLDVLQTVKLIKTLNKFDRLLQSIKLVIEKNWIISSSHFPKKQNQIKN